MRVALFNVELKDDLIPVPYIPRSKCIKEIDGKYVNTIYKGTYDNGRVLSAEVIGQITLTDIDYRILRSQYKFDMDIISVATARYGKLPQPLRDTVLSYYKDKTDLKDKPSDEEHTKDFYKLLYDKKKQLLNAQYGMTAQDPVKQTIKFIDSLEDLYKEDIVSPEEMLEQHNKRAFLAYQWGVW